MRHLLTLSDISREQFFSIIERGKLHRSNRSLAPDALRGKNVALIFEKSSTRTRLSFHAAVVELGGNVVGLEASALQLGRGETIEDTTEVFSRYLHAVMIRAKSHTMLERMAKQNSIPIINGLTDLYHPCQALADFMTLDQYGLDIRSDKLTMTFIGEGNNVFNSLALGSIYAGTRLRIASPKGYEPSQDVIDLVRSHGIDLQIFNDPIQAVKGANVIYTDVWVSMGQEEESQQRKQKFAPYCVSDELLTHAEKDCIVLHCLPAHRGEEITDSVMQRYGKYIFDQAENRLHVQKAILEWVFHRLD